MSLSSDPLYASTAGDKPTLALALSVEFPTVGALHIKEPRNAVDDSYSNLKEYLGYFDANGCYAYNDTPTESPATGLTRADYKRFDRVGSAIDRTCSDVNANAFSGNFLNWASSSAIDMMRIALSGGDRYIDTPDQTILQRAIIPNGDPTCMWNSQNFPGKVLARAGGTSGKPYWGAVPAIMATAAGSNDIYVGNTLNRIYFGTSWGGNCIAPSGYALGGLPMTSSIGRTPIESRSQSLPTDATLCAAESNACSFTGVREVWYGANNSWNVAVVSEGTTCTYLTFGDPLGGVHKSCYTRAYSGPSLIGPIESRSQSLPTDATLCAAESNACSFTGVREVWYGANNSWKVALVSEGTTCTYVTFGDPLVGVHKSCYIRAFGNSPMTSSIGPIESRSQSLPTDATLCAAESNACSFTGVREVWYGANDSWKVAVVSGGTTCTYLTFGDPLVGVHKSCYTRADSLNSDGFFYARVQVCQKDSAGNLLEVRDYDFCTKYPNGNYKPNGVIQKYGNRMRLAAFGYLMDQTASYNPGGRYGGVLRVPMKYVGGKTFDIYGADNTPAGGNPKAEWDMSTGVFTANPDGDTSQNPAISGVINYLNKFGRIGPVPGRYKVYDPVSEMYYETLRYLQGLQPSDDAVSNLTPAMYDGFPVHTTWSDPYGDGRPADGQYGCLKSNIVVVGDVNVQEGSNRYPSPDVTKNIPDLSLWRLTALAFERNLVSRDYTDGQGVGRATSNPNPSNLLAPSNAMIGWAYWAHTHDIRGTGWTDAPTKQRPGLRVKTFTFDVNEFGDQNIESLRRYRNQFFMTAKYAGFETEPANGPAFNRFGNPFQREDGTVDNNVWQDPSRPGEAAAYFMQNNARGVLTAFDTLFNRAASSARSIAGGAAQSTSVAQGATTTIYQGAFDTSNWTGDVVAITLTGTATGATIGSTPLWSASARLAALSNPNASRNIVIGSGGATTNPVATNFAWDAIPSTLQSALNKLSPTAVADGLGQSRLAYLRGDRSQEQERGLFRRRDGKLLGDIVNSNVVHVGAPSSAIQSTSYAEFLNEYKGRQAAVYVGANDGMLHAFKADTGDELFAYIPSWMGPKLSQLTDPLYLDSHQSFVDGPSMVAEAQLGTSGTKEDWKTVLVSGTGAGGRGVFALNVTNPATFTASDALWEFTSTDDADLGFVVGQPRIVKLRTNAANEPTPTYKWFAAVAGGVNNYLRDSAGAFSSTGKPTLFLLDLAKPAGTAWTLGSNYYKISLPVDTTLAASIAPGVLNLREVVDSDRVTTQIFAGDLHGNLWKLDFRARPSTEWDIAHLSAFYKGSEPAPLFIAKDADGNRQPISMAPILVAGESSISSYVAFGTGKYLEASDRGSTAKNSFYTVLDSGVATFDSSAGASVISGRGRLKSGTIDTNSGIVGVDPFVWGRATSDDDTTRRSGWYIDYAATVGERQISSAALAGDTLIFASLIPGSTNAAVCNVTAGSGRQYRLNVDTGDGSFRTSTVGFLGQPLMIELESAATETISNTTGRRVRKESKTVVDLGSDGLSSTSTQVTSIYTGRLSWRQISNYQDLKHAAAP
ncbi:hypothetical protein A8M77_02390 [Variovorax sp. JS1663]|nr:hypothetical protein A8M77_02390 [Variovorax sp. JS1663]